ncbi:MAG: phosphotransferase [Thermotaleaceae bacterium]
MTASLDCNPMGWRNLLTIEEIVYICSQYSIGNLKHIYGNFQKATNTNILFETDRGQYVAKILHTEIERFKNIIEIIKILNQREVPVLLPLQNIYGEYLVNIGEQQIQVTKYIPSYKFSYENRQVESSGAALRKIHEALKDYIRISIPKASIYPSQKVLKDGMERLSIWRHSLPKEYVLLIGRLHDEIIQKWEAGSKGLPQTVIHGDWNERNQLYTVDGKVCCVLDFDFMQRKERLFDIAYVLWNFLLHPKFNGFAKPFIQGYGELVEKEKEILQIAIARISLFFLCTASLSQDPIQEIHRQVAQQHPFIQHILSKEGERQMEELCK